MGSDATPISWGIADVQMFGFMNRSRALSPCKDGKTDKLQFVIIQLVFAEHFMQVYISGRKVEMSITLKIYRCCTELSAAGLKMAHHGKWNIEQCGQGPTCSLLCS